MIIGITGGTGCGKTTLLQQIEARGGLVLDCDAVYHELLTRDEVLLNAIDHRFPGVVVDKKLERKKLGAIVFSDEQALRDLNAITHGAIRPKSFGDWRKNPPWPPSTPSHCSRAGFLSFATPPSPSARPKPTGSGGSWSATASQGNTPRTGSTPKRAKAGSGKSATIHYIMMGHGRNSGRSVGRFWRNC